jgi:hypothetical protein
LHLRFGAKPNCNSEADNCRTGLSCDMAGTQIDPSCKRCTKVQGPSRNEAASMHNRCDQHTKRDL